MKPSSCTDDIIIYVGNPESPKEFLELGSDDSKTVGRKVTVPKSIAGLHLSNERVECDPKNTIPCV